MQKTILAIGASDCKGEFSYQTLRAAFGWRKDALSRSVRRLAIAELITRERFAHSATITLFGTSVVQSAMLKPSAGWWVAMQSATFYLQVTATTRDKDSRAARRKAQIVQQIVERCKAL